MLVFLQNSPWPDRILCGATVYYYTRETLCNEHPQQTYLYIEPVPDASTHGGVAPADTARPCWPITSHIDAPTGPTSNAELARDPERRPEAKR